MAADVYTAEGHVGRGGWSWYTGSASWMYRVGLEGVLGLRKRGDTLAFEPCVPSAWPEFTVTYRHGRSTYDVTVRRPGEARQGSQVVTLDGRQLPDESIPLVDDGAHHIVVIEPRG